MTTPKRRHFSGAEKVGIIRSHLLEQIAISDLCEKHQIKPTQYYSWQKRFFERGAASFTSTEEDPQKRRLRQQNEKLKGKLAQKDEIIAEVAEAFVSLKKELGAL